MGQGASRAARRLRARGRGRRPHSPRPAAAGRVRLPRLRAEKKKRGVVDFDDLIWQCADAFERDPEFAAAQRWRFRHLFVDEFQDASAAQFRLLHAWLGDRPDLCVVGDGDQAIYGFAGADPDYLGGSRSSSRASATPTSASSRSAATTGPRPRWSPPRTRCWGAGRRATVRAAPARRPRARGSPTTSPTKPRRVAWRARCVPARPRPAVAAHRGAVPHQRAIGRVRGGAEPAGVPFRVRGGGRFLERPEVQVALDTLRKTARAAPGRSFSEHLTDLTVDAEMSEERREHTDALVRLGHEYLEAEGGQGSVDGFLAYLDTALRGDDADAVSGDAVELSRSTAPRGSSSTPCSSPASNAASYRSRTRSPPRRSTRSNACSTSP